ncbi:hypothetical protein K466DRAFT_604304 [Polyporus arcularius HHB13444]|uniref:Uncharacterized protein n=1 Tax=Polyporus arcularius HHB13444 TaxID=1314778 RepID=A0A5C3NYR7_9APHY|nr:hypothetical protein K466DRAFT_604304 [Polyporus arcularius HHB13444]
MSPKRPASQEPEADALPVSKSPRKERRGATPSGTADVAVQTDTSGHTPSLRLAGFLDYKSQHPLPWYALTQVPQRRFWKPISRVENLLTSEEVVLGVWTTGLITRIAIYTGIADSATRTQLTIQLLRQQDRDALQQLHESARLSTAAKTESINTDKVNIVVREDSLHVLETVYDAIVKFEAKDRMSTISAGRLKVGHVVVKEEINEYGTIITMHWPVSIWRKDENAVVQPARAGSTRRVKIEHEDDETSRTGEDVRVEAWVPVSATALIRVLLDFSSTHPDPWYAIAKVPVADASWESRSSTLSILTIRGVAARLFTVGPVSGMCFYTASIEEGVRSRISINLMRSEDRAALGGMHNVARCGAPKQAAHPVDCFTAIAMHEDEKGFTNVYDATSSLRAREDMSTMRPWTLRVGDIVLIESVVVRTQLADGWKVSYHTDGIFRLARRPVLEGKRAVAVNPVHVPPVRFPFSL